jgi:hypothetical protein
MSSRTPTAGSSRPGLAPHGLVTKYDKDRAKLDMGLHLFERPPAPNPHVSNVRVWFQLKGAHSSTLWSQGPRARATTVPVTVLPTSDRPVGCNVAVWVVGVGKVTLTERPPCGPG